MNGSKPEAEAGLEVCRIFRSCRPATSSLSLPPCSPAHCRLSAQWTNRYQRIGQGHHVYVEGYDFPTYSVGPPIRRSPPDGATLAFSARGWLWTMPAAGGPAHAAHAQGAGLDSRPAWHPDGRRIAFVRDDTRNTDIVEIDLPTGAETLLVGGPAAELDPAYAPGRRRALLRVRRGRRSGDLPADFASGAKTPHHGRAGAGPPSAAARGRLRRVCFEAWERRRVAVSMRRVCGASWRWRRSPHSRGRPCRRMAAGSPSRSRFSRAPSGRCS